MGSGEGDASWDEHWRELRRWAEWSTLSKATYCGRCDHPMHWKVCGTDCECRSDVTRIEAKEDDPKAKTEY